MEFDAVRVSAYRHKKDHLRMRIVHYLHCIYSYFIRSYLFVISNYQFLNWYMNTLFVAGPEQKSILMEQSAKECWSQKFGKHLKQTDQELWK